MTLFYLAKNVYFIRMETTGLFELMFDHNPFKYKYMYKYMNTSTCSYVKSLVMRASEGGILSHYHYDSFCESPWNYL